MLSHCLKDRNGQYNYPNLETAINKFIANMVQIRVLRGLYELLKKNGDLPQSVETIDSEDIQQLQRITAMRMKDIDRKRRQSRRGTSYNMTDMVTSIFSFESSQQKSQSPEYADGISWKEVSIFLNGVMNTMNEEDELSKEEVCDVISEISTRRDDSITLFDFVNLFRAG